MPSQSVHIQPFTIFLHSFFFQIFPFKLYNIFLPKHTILLEIDETGSIVNSFHDPTGKTINGGIGEAFQVGDKIYLGHFMKTYLGVISVDDLYRD